VLDADLVIGAVLVPGAAAPRSTGASKWPERSRMAAGLMYKHPATLFGSMESGVWSLSR